MTALATNLKLVDDDRDRDLALVPAVRVRWVPSRMDGYGPDCPYCHGSPGEEGCDVCGERP